MTASHRHILIVDDEPPARERLVRLLGEIAPSAQVDQAANGKGALERCAHTDYDIVLMDIRMPGMDGIEVARHLAQVGRAPAVVFTTAYDQYAIEAFDTEAVAYLLKPVRRAKLESALERAARLPARAAESLAREARSTRHHVVTRRGDTLSLIPVRDVIYFEADQKYVRAWHRGGDDLIDDALKALEDEFSDEFVRIHRSLLVALRQVDSVEKDEQGATRVRLRNRDTVLPVSRRHVATLRERLLG